MRELSRKELTEVSGGGMFRDMARGIIGAHEANTTGYILNTIASPYSPVSNFITFRKNAFGIKVAAARGLIGAARGAARGLAGRAAGRIMGRIFG